jgi:hypothetical protein
VTVKVQRTGLPTLFSRIWSRTTNTVSATATAEVFNPSDSGAVAGGGQEIPVIPRCVKPWILADEDPGNAGQRFVARRNGRILSPRIFPVNGSGVIGESFILTNDCNPGPNCSLANPTPQATNYVPALVNTSQAAVAVPSCSADDFQNYVAGCDEGTVYACGTVNGAQADLTKNRGTDTSAGVQCLINAPGNDSINTAAYPFQIIAGSSNPIFSGSSNQTISSSNSIMTLPLYDDRAAGNLASGTQPQVTIVGFLQVFVDNTTDSNGDMQVTVLNVAGCGDAASTTLSAPGSSPVPIRLITPQ